VIVGIDNGLAGGLVALSRFDGGIISKIVMPTKTVGKKREIDIRAINEWLLDFNTPFTLAIEEPLAHAKSSQAVRSMALSYGKLLGMAEAKGYDVFRVSISLWQKTLLGKVPKGMTKKRALQVVTELVPDEDWTKNSRCRVPHDGMVDAYLIGRYLWGLEKLEKTL
jgi:hypothetical protein